MIETQVERVCPRCGDAANEHRFCPSCGLNLAIQAELPTREEWERRGSAPEAALPALATIAATLPPPSASSVSSAPPAHRPPASGGAPRGRRRLAHGWRGLRLRTRIAVLAPFALLAVAAAVFVAVDDDAGPETEVARTAPAAAEPTPAPEAEAPAPHLPTVTNAGFSNVWNSGGAGLEGSPIRIAARVYQDAGNFFLAYADPAQDEFPVQVFTSSAAVSEDEYVLIDGTLTGSDTYETVAGGEVDVITIDGESVETISEARAAELANPPIGGKEKLNLSQTRGGFTVTLKSISWTEDATRLDVEITNNGSATASLMTFDAKIQQGTRQFGIDDMAEGGEDLSDDIRPGVTERGTLTFEKISKKRGTGYLELEWLSNNYDVDSDQPFAFTMSWGG